MDPKYIIKERKTTPFGPFHVDEATIQIVDSNGLRTEQKRISFERGDSVAILVHDTGRDEIVLVQQFRYSVLASRGEQGTGWLLEIPAGIKEKGEDPDITALREVEEEIGLSITAIEHISTFFVSPGGTSERIFLFYGVAGEAMGPGGGLAREGERIKIERLPTAIFFDKISSNSIRDAKTIIAGYWLRERLTRNI